jgi:histidinol-phosphate aminotransferase
MTGRTADPIPVARVRRLEMVPLQVTPLDPGKTWPVRSLHLNEAPFAPAASVVAAMQEAAACLNRYPDHDGTELVAMLAQRTGVPVDRLVIGSGTNELLFASADISLDPDDEALAPVPGFPTYAKTITLRGARHIGVSVKPDGVVDVAAMIAAIGPRTRLVYIATPHNPTGGALSREEVDILVDRLPDHVLLHFDEAYYEFGRHAGAPEALPILARRRGPWIATRSFSKAYGLAGARVGYGIASSRELADAYRKIRVNFSVNAVALAGARAALCEEAHTAALLDHTAGERERLAKALERFGLRVLPSAANFVTAITTGSAVALAGALARKNIFVLPVPWPSAGGALRITIGTREDTDAVIAALGEVFATS